METLRGQTQQIWRTKDHTERTSREAEKGDRMLQQMERRRLCDKMLLFLIILVLGAINIMAICFKASRYFMDSSSSSSEN